MSLVVEIRLVVQFTLRRRKLSPLPFNGFKLGLNSEIGNNLEPAEWILVEIRSSFLTFQDSDPSWLMIFLQS